MQKLKEYWFVLVGAVVGLVGLLAFFRKSDTKNLDRAQAAEVAVIDAKIDAVKQAEEKIEEQPKPVAQDASPEQVNDFWKNNLK